jgi:hypothetical protein
MPHDDIADNAYREGMQKMRDIATKRLSEKREALAYCWLVANNLIQQGEALPHSKVVEGLEGIRKRCDEVLHDG